MSKSEVWPCSLLCLSLHAAGLLTRSNSFREFSEDFTTTSMHILQRDTSYCCTLNTLSQVPLHLSTPLSRLCCSTLPLIPITASCKGAALILSSCTPIRLRKLLWDVHVSHAAESAINGNILCQPGGLSCWPKSSAHDEIYGDVHRQEGHCRQETCLND